MINEILPSIPIFSDTDGSPLDNGQIYIGTSGLNPITNQVQVYWDSSLTIPASQPLTTTNGRLSRDGSPSKVYTRENDWSTTVLNKNSTVVYSNLTGNSENKPIRTYAVCFSDNSDTGLVGAASKGVIAVGDVLRTDGGLSSGDGGSADIHCSSLANIPTADRTQVVGNITISWVGTDFWVPYGGQGYQFKILDNEKYYEQLGFSSSPAPSTLPTLTKLRNGKLFSLAQIVSKSDYDSIREETNTTDYSDLLSNVLEDVVNLYIPQGLWYIGDIDPNWRNHTLITGDKGRSYTFSQGAGSTILRRHSTKTNMFLNVPSVKFENLELDGDGSGTLINGTDSSVYVYGCKVFNGSNGFDGNGSYTPIYAWDTVWRGHSGYGIRDIKDSFIHQCYFAGNRSGGLYLNGGQIDIGHCFLEFQQNSGAESPAILIDRNGNEIKIHNNTFDRNAGNDVRLLTSGSDSPTDIMIVNNIMKGAAWAMTSRDQAYSIFCNGEAQVTVGGNKFQRRPSNPSGVLGNISPLGCYNLESAKSVVDLGNDAGNVTSDINLNAYGLSWVQSSANPLEYYLVSNHPSANSDPYIYSADFYWDETQNVQLASGTVGSLSANQYDWGVDNDSLGFNTLYVRLDGSDPNNQDIFAIYDNMVFKGPMGSADRWSTPEFQDLWRGSINNGNSANALLTMDGIASTVILDTTFSTGYGVIRIHGDETFTAAEGFYDVHFTLERAGSGAGISVRQGTITTNESGFSIGWSGSGSDLELSLSAKKLGRELTLAMTNNSGNRLDLVAQLMRN